MSVGRVTTSHFLNHKDKFFIQVLSEEHTKGILAQSPVGHSILRVNLNESGRSVLIVSYKYSKLIFSKTIPSITMKVTSTGSIFKCRTNQKNYKYLRKLATDFLVRLQLFINMFVNNHNFIERDLSSDNEIEAELTYRKFLIFPRGDRVILKRKCESGIQTAALGFDFEEMTFFAEQNGNTLNVETFNEFLISEFLKIDFRDKLQVQYALGHQSRSLEFSESDNFDQLDIRTELNDSHYDEHTNIRNKDKDKLIERLRQSTEGFDTSRAHSGPNDSRHLLVTILESVSCIRSQSEQMEWINRGIFDLIFKILLHNNGNTARSIAPIKIAKLLLRGNAEGCKIFVKRYIQAFDSNFEWSCIDIYTSLTVLMSLPKFRETFLQELGVPRLIEIYTQASFLLLRDMKQNANAMGEICGPPTDTMSSPRSEIFSDMDDAFDSSDESEEDDETSEDILSTNEGLALTSVGKIAIPKLMIPVEQSEGTRKRDKTEVEFQRTATEELTTLAQNLGETYMTQDLTALSSFLQNDTGVKARKKERVSVSITADSFDTLKPFMRLTQDKSNNHNSNYYKIKCAILKAFARLTVHWEYFDLIANPVNLLYSELLHCHKDNLYTGEIEFRKLIYDVLANYANHVEHMHCYRWQELTRGFSVQRAKGLRQKVDKFIWRIHNQLAPAIEVKDYEQMELQLTLLAEYMKYCPTGITSMQVSTVCMELLLKVKDIVLSRGRITTTNMEHIHLTYCIVSVFDQIALGNEFGQLREVLLSLLIEKKETWRFVKHFACQILLNKKLEKSIIGAPCDVDKARDVELYRSQAILHFQVCYQLIQQQIRFYLEEEKKQVPYATEARQTVENYVHNFEFLIDPNRSGYILQILSTLKGTTTQPEYQKDILRLLISIFSAEDCVFLKNKAYIDAYVTYAYLSFIKLYHSLYTDEDTLELIQLHLELLLVFAQNKNDKIIMKFYQLRVMDFLVREINLEYEITQRNKTKTSAVETPLSSGDFTIPPKEEKQEKPEKEEQPAPSEPQSKVVAVGSEEGEVLQRVDNDLRLKTVKQSAKRRSFNPFGKNKKEEKHRKMEKQRSHERIITPMLDDFKSEPRGGSHIGGGSHIVTGSPKVQKVGHSTAHKRKWDSLKEKSKKRAELPIIRGPSKTMSRATAKELKEVKDGSSDLTPLNIVEDADGNVIIQSKSNPVSPEKDKPKEESLEEETEETEESESGEYETDEETEESEYETEEETEEESEDSEEYPKKGPAIPSLSGVPLKCNATKPTKQLTAAEKLKAATGGTGLSLTGDMIKGGTAEKPKLGAMPKLSLAEDMIKGGSSTKAKSKTAAEKMKGGGIPKLSLADDMIKGGTKAAPQSTDTELYEDEEKMGNLSKLESKIDKNDPKWQLIFESKKKEESAASEDILSQTDIQEINKLYRKERKERKLYASQKVHITALQLIFSLLLAPCGTLEHLYTDQFPLDNKKLNIPFLLGVHLSHPGNSLLIPPLVAETQKMGRSVFRLLKLLCAQLFRKDDYNELKRLAIGAYGTVYRCRLKPECQATNVAIKLMEVPKSIHDRCVLHDIFDEILVLDKFKDDNRISHTYDFGRDEDYFWITMKKYKCSLKHWRKEQKAPLQQNLALYLNIYMNALNAFQFLTENRVNHFDVKCDNFLIQPLNEENWTVQDEENFWDPVSDVPNFYVCLADFGEAKVYDKEIDGYTTRNRGTEFTKSPEMLVVAYASQKTRATYDRRKKVGASSPSDIWSLGCLLYELLTGEFLFYDQDWVRFFIRVTSQGQELLTPEKIEKIDNNQILVEFLRFVLNRDPFRRPSIYDVIQRFKYVRAQLTSKEGAPSPRFPNTRKPVTRKRNSSVPEMNESSKTAPYTPPMAASLTHESVHPVSVEESKNSETKTTKTKEKDSTDEKFVPPTLAHSISHRTLSVSSERPERAKLIRPGMEYFLENVSQLTEYLFLGPIDEVCKRDVLKRLRITHMINCTKEANLYSTEFFTLQVPITKENPEPLAHSIEALVSFINEARFHNGRVLVYSGDGTSRGAAVVVAYLMVTRNWSYFESMLFVKDSRFVIDIDEPLVKILCQYHRYKQKSRSKQYQCLCGACAITVSDSFNQSYFPNPFPCSCTLEDEPTKCPNIGCSEYISEMKRLFQYGYKEVMWGYTTRSSIIGDLSRSTRPYSQYKELCIETPEDVVNKSWTVYKCRSCDFITHALRKKNATDNVVNSHFDVAVVTSIAVSRSDTQ